MKKKKYLATFTYKVELEAKNDTEAEDLALENYESFVENVRDLDLEIEEIKA